MRVRAVLTKPHEVKVRFTSRALFLTLKEIVSLRSLTLEAYLMQLAESDAAEHRRLKLTPSFLMDGLREKSKPAGNISSRYHNELIKKGGRTYGRLPEDQTEELLSLSQHLTLEQLARRFNTSATTVSRILRDNGWKCSTQRQGRRR
jgi:hypothetical protein